MKTSGVRQYFLGGRRVHVLGFTLIELMIVVVIIAILAAIAYPTYISYITKTRRNAATACLSEYSNFMERYYTTNLSYMVAPSTSAGTPTRIALPTLDCAAATQTGPYYTYAFPATAASVTPTAYEIKATPQAAQATRDTKCGTLSIDQTGARGASGPMGNGACWNR